MELTMQYMLLIYSDEAQWFGMPQEQIQKALGEYMKYSKALVEAGVMRGGSELKPISTATTVKVRNGKALTTDGPFAETKEQLGGYYLIETPTLDEALKWAAQCPGAHHGTVEVRPLQENPSA
jgi:hypothetical protein